MSDLKTLVCELRTALFWVITQRVVVIYCWRFGTTYRSHPQGTRTKISWFWIIEPWGRNR